MIMKNGSLIRIVCGDPARRYDAFGIVVIESDISKDIIRIGLAKQFFNQPYSVVANYLTKIQNNIHPDFMGIETNYRGEKLLQLFNYKYKLDIKGEFAIAYSNSASVHTPSELKSSVSANSKDASVLRL